MESVHSINNESRASFGVVWGTLGYGRFRGRLNGDGAAWVGTKVLTAPNR